MKRTAMIVGITGQDGSYLSEFLLEKGYEVHGVVRRPGNEATDRLGTCRNQIVFHQADVLDHHSLFAAIRSVRPDEIYNLAAQSFIPLSWTHPVLTMNYTAAAVIGILEAIRSPECAHTRYFQASSSEVYAGARVSPQNESTPFAPKNPYGSAKVYAQCITKNYREYYNMFCVTGVLFNHESPRRGKEFVTRKTTSAVAQIKAGLLDKLELGNLESVRDWGFAGDYVRGMWLALQHDEPDDYVFGTGQLHSVRDLVNVAFDHAGLDPDKYLSVNPQLIRTEPDTVLVADPRKARDVLGWQPEVTFEQLIKAMVDADIQAIANTPRDHS